MDVSKFLWSVFLQMTHMDKKKAVAWQHFLKINFRNEAKIHEISKNLATRKFPSIQYIYAVIGIG